MQSTEFRPRVIALEVLVDRCIRIQIAEEAFIIAVCYYTFVERRVLQTGFKVITWGAVGLCPKKICALTWLQTDTEFSRWEIVVDLLFTAVWVHNQSTQRANAITNGSQSYEVTDFRFRTKSVICIQKVQNLSGTFEIHICWLAWNGRDYLVGAR